MSQPTIRGMVRLIQIEVRDTPDLQPDRAADLLRNLAGLLGNLNDEIRQADAEFATVLLHHLDSEEAANRAKIRAETTPAFQRKREARDTKELAVELIRSLKFFLKAKQDEYQMSRHM
jgi:uncharacterized protein (DUF1501 family)